MLVYPSSGNLLNLFASSWGQESVKKTFRLIKMFYEKKKRAQKGEKGKERHTGCCSSSRRPIAYSTTTSSSIPMSSTIFLAIHGLMTDKFTFLISTYTKIIYQQQRQKESMHVSTFLSNSGGNFMLLRSLSSLSENRLSWSAEVPLKNPEKKKNTFNSRVMTKKGNKLILPASAMACSSKKVFKFKSVLVRSTFKMNFSCKEFQKNVREKRKLGISITS